MQKKKMPRYLQCSILLGFLLGFVLLPTVNGQEYDMFSGPDITYVLLVLAELHHPGTEKCCMVLEGIIYDFNVTITVTLEVQGQKIPILLNSFLESGMHCWDFLVPPPIDGTSVEAAVRIVAEGDVTFEESKSVLIKRMSDKVVIQTDKPSYRASETVKIRILTLNENFLCGKTEYHDVELRDPQNNCIFQWLEVSTTMCIADLSYKLTTDPLLGTYTIIVEKGLAYYTFEVDQIVLPRFEVRIFEPATIFAVDLTFTVKACGIYTYGKGVRGILQIVLCRKQDWFSNLKYCITVGGKTDANGCFETQVNGRDLDISNPNFSSRTVVITADLTEDGTGITLSATREVSISFVVVIITFEDMDSFYKSGHEYNITLVVKDRDGSPLQFIEVVVEVTFVNHMCIIDETTDDCGRAQFSLDTTEWKGQVKIRGYIKFVNITAEKLDGTVTDVTQNVRPYYSKSVSFLRLEPIYAVIPCGHVVHIRVIFNICQSELRKYCRIVRFYYLVIGKNGIMLHDQITIIKDENDPLYGTITIPITFTSAFGSAPKMVGFVLLRDGLIAADRLLFSVEKCFPNWASLKFSRAVVLPKDRLVLNVCSSAGSLCAIRAVDKSVQINNEDKELTPEKLFEMFQDTIRGGYPDSVWEGPYPFSNCWWPWSFSKFFIPDFENDFVDVLSIFRETGVKILTNCQILQPQKKQKPCFFPIFFAVAEKEQVMEAQSPILPGQNSLVRKWFPETWLWKFVLIDDSTKSSIDVIAPDTITQFNARAFCLGSSGLGFSSEESLTVYKPFFVDMALPRSIVQGETFILKVTVFNYLEYCIKVIITLISSRNFTVQGCQQQCVNSSCICANETQTFTWNITATTTGVLEIIVRVEAVASNEACNGRPISVPSEGNIDILQRQLLVKPRGIRKEVTENSYLCLNASVPRVEILITIVLPKVWVANSQSAIVVVMGDVLGSTLANLGNLITMPYGCGEQNMITLCPMIFVLVYLDTTGQLTTAQRANALYYMQDGYARQLQYKRTDGSFSAFGNSDPEGSTWLTAFVVKCFCQATVFIYIDPNVISQGIAWIRQKQKSDGSFWNKGMMYHTNMKGGVEDEESLCSYCVVAVIECGTLLTDPVVVLALSWLRNKVATITKTYTMALMAYTFALANEPATKQILLDKLFLLAISSGGDLYWTYSLQNYQGTASVELTAYVLLALCTGPGVTANDLLKANRIISWMVRQQSPQGGYASTQDTIVAIQALSKCMMSTFNPRGSLTITVYNGRTIVVTFRVTQTNRIVLQTSALPNVPGKYRVVVEGNGCVLIQSVTKYNLDPVKIPSAFTINVRIKCDCDSGIFTIVITVSYIGHRNVTNMVLIEVEMLSGFTISGQPGTELLKKEEVKRVDFTNDIFIIYIEQLFPGQPCELSFQIELENVVHGLKPANIKVYDYYMLEENAVTSYNACRC